MQNNTQLSCVPHNPCLLHLDFAMLHVVLQVLELIRAECTCVCVEVMRSVRGRGCAVGIWPVVNGKNKILIAGEQTETNQAPIILQNHTLDYVDSFLYSRNTIHRCTMLEGTWTKITPTLVLLPSGLHLRICFLHEYESPRDCSGHIYHCSLLCLCSTGYSLEAPSGYLHFATCARQRFL